MADDRLAKIVSKYARLNPDQLRTVRKHMENDDLNALITCDIFTEFLARKVWEEYQGILYLRNPKIEQGPHKMLFGLIMGTCGSGKTALMNNLLGTSYDSRPSETSLTQNIQCRRLAYLNGSRLVLYDTPGTTSLDQVSRHATFLKAILTRRPYNVILINVKYNNRWKELVQNMKDQCNMVASSSANVVFMVSYFDLEEEDPQHAIRKISELMTQRNMDQQVVFYSNRTWNHKRLSDVLYKIVSNYPETRIFISEEDFYRNFRVGHIDQDFRLRYKEVLDQIANLPEIYIQAANDLTNNEKAKILPEMALSLKFEMQVKVDKLFQEDEIQNMLLTNDYYGVYYSLQKQTTEANERFQEVIRPFLELSTISQHSKAAKDKSLLDQIKQCPMCHEIWVLVEACPNTTCGMRPNNYWDFSVGTAYFKYQFEVRNGRLEVMDKVSLQDDCKARLDKLDKAWRQRISESKTLKALWELKNSKKSLQADKQKLLSRSNTERGVKEVIAKGKWIKAPLGQENISELITFGRRKIKNDNVFGMLEQMNNSFDKEAKAYEKVLKLQEKESSGTTSTTSKTTANSQAYLKDPPVTPQMKALNNKLVDLLIARKKVCCSSADKMEKEVKDRTLQQATEKEPARGELMEEIYCLKKVCAWLRSECNQIEKTEKNILSNTPNTLEDRERHKQRIDEFNCLALEILDIKTKGAILQQSSIKTTLAERADLVANPQKDKIIRQAIAIAILDRSTTELPRLELQIIQVDRQIVKENQKKTVRGCGYPMNFDVLPRIPNIQERLKGWYNVSDISELEAIMNAKQEIRTRRRELEIMAHDNIQKCEEHLAEVEKPKPK